MSLAVVPCTTQDARIFIAKYHRHHKPPMFSHFSLAVADGDAVIGVAVVGRPSARMLQDGTTAEVTRLCTDGTKNACSMLYGACWRAAKALGYKRLVTYILDTEPGTSLNAAGWTLIGKAGGGTWDRPSRPREDKHPTQGKLRFERTV